ncbi:MAG TPA: BON domain-containing protein [Acidiferrobacterales bacterium]
MPAKDTILREIRAALEHEPRINVHRHPIHLDYRNGSLALEGEVDSIAAKKLALLRAKALNGMHNVVDRLRVLPGEARGDGAVRASLGDFLLHEPTLLRCRLMPRHKGRVEMLRDAGDPAAGWIEFDVTDGVVQLTGQVESLSHKRLAGVLAWWTPGRRDVVNELEIVPMEYDNDPEIADALRLVLEIDPMVDADQVSISVRDAVVTLQGLLVSDDQKKRAELDAWYVDGVTDVVNHIIVGH